MLLELSLHALKLKNVAGAFKGTSDPFAVVTKLKTTGNAPPKVLGKTEVVKNSLSPQWTKVFELEYTLGEPCKVAVSIFDEVRKGDNKPMGSAVFDVAELLGARGNTKAIRLKKGGTIFAQVRKSTGSGMMRLKMKGTKLKNVEGGLFGKSDPFFELSRKIDAAGGLTWDNIFRSPTIKNNLNPDWETAVVPLSQLCGGDLDAPVLISVYDYESSGKHVSMGTVETSVKALQAAAQSGHPLELTRKGKGCGTLTIEKAEVSGIDDATSRMAKASISSTPAAASVPAAFAPAAAGRANFIDYVSGGCELNVVVAIDFTGSNGDPRKPGTLHYLDPNGGDLRNDYEKAIGSIVSILAKYDSDQKFPVLGFGAKYDGVVRHCFQVGNSQEQHGVRGVIEAYRQVFRTGLIMSSPTIFNEVIENAAARAESSMMEAQRSGGQAYTILLIVTDGAVSDVQATAACLNRVSDKPLSIVIVGVGNADFSSMRFLDDSAGPGKRDIAQFVPFNKFSHSSAELSRETLHEIPDQLVGHFQSRGIQPLAALQRTDSTVSITDQEEEEIDLSLDITEDEIVVTGGGDDFVSGFHLSR